MVSKLRITTAIVLSITLTIVILLANKRGTNPPEIRKEYPSNVQPVCISFDGSKRPSAWNRILKSASSITNKKVKYTFFISGVYFICDSNASIYKAPDRQAKESWINFGGTTNEIKERILCIREAIKDGHEIGSHLCGHHTGIEWTYEQWKKEFDWFHRFLTNVSGHNNIEKHWNITNDIKGIRAPELGINPAYFKMLNDVGYVYDCSTINIRSKEIETNKYGTWVFPLTYTKRVNSKTNTNVILLMDYNWYLYHSKARPSKENINTMKRWENDVFNTYMDYFKDMYYGPKLPIQIGHHFSPWNNYIYWNALTRFINEISQYKEVIFMTYEELARYYETHNKLSSTTSQNNNRIYNMGRRQANSTTSKQTSISSD